MISEQFENRSVFSKSNTDWVLPKTEQQSTNIVTLAAVLYMC